MSLQTYFLFHRVNAFVTFVKYDYYSWNFSYVTLVLFLYSLCNHILYTCTNYIKGTYYIKGFIKYYTKNVFIIKFILKDSLDNILFIEGDKVQSLEEMLTICRDKPSNRPENRVKSAWNVSARSVCYFHSGC